MEKTYVMLKPDAIQRKLMGQILTRIERKGLQIENMKMFTLNETILKEHYAHLKNKPFFPEIVEYMTSGPVVGMIVSGANAVAAMRKILGARHNSGGLYARLYETGLIVQRVYNQSHPQGVTPRHKTVQPMYKAGYSRWD